MPQHPKKIDITNIKFEKETIPKIRGALSVLGNELQFMNDMNFHNNEVFLVLIP